MNKKAKASTKEIIIFFILLSTLAAYIGIFALSETTVFYKGFSVDSAGRVYVAETKGIAVYQNTKRINYIRVRGATYGGEAYDFSIVDDAIHVWNGQSRIILTLDGEEVTRVPEAHSFDYRFRTQTVDLITDEGKHYMMENRFIGRPKIVCFSENSEQAVVFQMPIATYFLKLTFPVVLLLTVGWGLISGIWKKQM